MKEKSEMLQLVGIKNAKTNLSQKFINIFLCI